MNAAASQTTMYLSKTLKVDCVVKAILLHSFGAAALQHERGETLLGRFAFVASAAQGGSALPRPQAMHT